MLLQLGEEILFATLSGGCGGIVLFSDQQRICRRCHQWGVFGWAGILASHLYAIPYGYSICSWLEVCVVLVWIWKTEEIERRCGKTAAQYLRFQELVIRFVTIITVAATLVVLPVNIRGHMFSSRMNFGRTTLNNINPQYVITKHLVQSLYPRWIIVITGHTSFGFMWRSQFSCCLSHCTLLGNLSRSAVDIRLRMWPPKPWCSITWKQTKLRKRKFGCTSRKFSMTTSPYYPHTSRYLALCCP